MKGSKYIQLAKYVEDACADEMIMTFNRVKEENGGYLPKSAYTYAAWWANESNKGHHVHTSAWRSSGYKTREINFTNQTVCFYKEQQNQN